VRSAAVALQAGWGDPLAFLGLSPRDAEIAAAVANEALEQRRKYDESLAAAMGAEAASRLAPPLMRAIRDAADGVAKTIAKRPTL